MPFRPIWKRADESWFQGRLGVEAVRQYKIAARLLTLFLVIAPAGPALGLGLLLTRGGDHRAIGLGIALTGVPFGVAGLIQLRRVQLVVGAENGFTPAESRRVDISSPQMFDRSVARIRQGEDSAASTPDSDSVSTGRPPLNWLAIASAAAAFGVIFSSAVGFFSLGLARLAFRANRRRPGRGLVFAHIGELVGVPSMIYWVMMHLLVPYAAG